MNYNCTCTRCGGTGEGVTVQQAKFSCHHKVGCGRKIGILDWNTPNVTSTTGTVSIQATTTAGTETVTLSDPTLTETPKPKKKKASKKAQTKILTS